MAFDGSPISLELYEQDGATLAAPSPNLAQASNISFMFGEKRDGEVSFSLPMGTPSAVEALYADPKVVRVSLGGEERFDAYLSKGTSTPSDEGGGRVTINALGLRSTFRASLIQPYYPDCPPVDTGTQRMLGVADPNYDVSGLPGVYSYGYWYDQENIFPGADESPRGPNFPDKTAQFITHGPSFDKAPGETFVFSPDFSVSESGRYILAAVGDDEYDVYLVGQLIGSSYGAYSWKVTDLHAVYLCALYNYRIVARYNNLDRTEASGVADSPAWFLGSLLPTDSEGNPVSRNQIWDLYINASAGNFTLNVNGGPYTAGIAYNAGAAAVQTALEGLANVGSGNVQVTGSGTAFTNHQVEIYNDATAGQFTLTVDSLQTNLIDYNASAATIKARIEELPGIDTVTVTGSGTAGSPWVVTFDGPLVQGESHSVSSTDGPGFNGTTTITVTATGSAGDPFLIEFINDLSQQALTMDADDSLMTGTATLIEDVVGASSEYIIHTDLSWRYLSYPVTQPGLNAGEMLNIVIAEMQARGASVFDYYTPTYTNSLDSDGVAWNKEFTFGASPYLTSVYDLVEFLEGEGIDIFFTPGWELNIVQDKSNNLAGTVDISDAKFAQDTQLQQDREVRNVLYSQDQYGNWVERVHAGSVAVNGRWEEPYSAPIGTRPVVEYWQDNALKDSASSYREHTLILSQESGDQIPFKDFDWSDEIVGPEFSGFYPYGQINVVVVAIGARTVDLNNATEFIAVVVEQ